MRWNPYMVGYASKQNSILGELFPACEDHLYLLGGNMFAPGSSTLKPEFVIYGRHGLSEFRYLGCNGIFKIRIRDLQTSWFI